DAPVVGDVHQALQHPARWHAEERGYLVDRALARRVHLGGRLEVGGLRAARRSPAARRRDLEVCGVLTLLAHRDDVLAALHEHLELRAGAAAHRAGVRGHHAIVEPEAVEDAPVSETHRLVALHRARIVHVERIGILHGELAAPEEPRARPRFVAILGLDL